MIYPTVLDLCDKVLVAVGVYRCGFCNKLLEVSPLFEREPIPARSKTDPLLAKAEPISDSGNTSVIIFLRREKKLGQTENGSRREE